MIYIFRLTKERDEQIELVIERLETEKEELIKQNTKEVAAKVNEIHAEKREVEQELKDFKSKLTELSNAVLLVQSFSEANKLCCSKSVHAMLSVNHLLTGSRSWIV